MKLGYPRRQICRCLALAVSSFYYQLTSKIIDVESIRSRAVMKLIHRDIDATDGKHRMQFELQSMGFTIDIDKIRLWMKQLCLVTKRPKQHSYHRDGRHPSSHQTSLIANLTLSELTNIGR